MQISSRKIYVAFILHLVQFSVLGIENIQVVRAIDVNNYDRCDRYYDEEDVCRVLREHIKKGTHSTMIDLKRRSNISDPLLKHFYF